MSMQSIYSMAYMVLLHVSQPCLPASSSGESPELDKLRAVHRLVENHEAVAKFAARGCGQQGSPPVNAPLSDPNAKPGMQYLDAVDAGQLLRLVLSFCCCCKFTPNASLVFESQARHTSYHIVYSHAPAVV